MAAVYLLLDVTFPVLADTVEHHHPLAQFVCDSGREYRSRQFGGDDDVEDLTLIHLIHIVHSLPEQFRVRQYRGDVNDLDALACNGDLYSLVYPAHAITPPRS